MAKSKYKTLAITSTAFLWNFPALSSEAQDVRFPESITCTPSISVAASVQTGVLIYPKGGEPIVWQYIGEEQYMFLNEGKEVLFSTRHLTSGAILELLRNHTTYSIDLVNERFVMVQAMAGDPEIPNPAIGALVSGPCSMPASASESNGEP